MSDRASRPSETFSVRALEIEGRMEYVVEDAFGICESGSTVDGLSPRAQAVWARQSLDAT
jgi:hypothetical protein